MKDGYFDRYEANGFHTYLSMEGPNLRITRIDTATGRESNASFSPIGLEKLSFVLLKYFDVEMAETDIDNPWEFNPRRPFPWYLHSNLVNFRGIIPAGQEDYMNRGILLIAPENDFRQELRSRYSVPNDNKRVEIDKDNNVYVVSGSNKMVFHWSEISRLLRGIQQSPHALQGSLLPLFEKWERERVSELRFDEEKARHIERGKADFMPPGSCLCEFNDDMGLSKSCFNTVIGETCSSENSCMYCYDARNNRNVPGMYDFIRNHKEAGIDLKFAKDDRFKNRKTYIPVRTGKVCEPGHIIVRSRLISMLEETGGNRNIYRIFTGKNLGIDTLVAANTEQWNTVLQFSVSDTPFAKIERGANWWNCDNEERIRAAVWYKEQGKNVCFRLMWDITGEKSDFVRHIDEIAEKHRIPVLHTPPRFGSNWLSLETLGKTWDELKAEGRYINTFNSDGTPGDITPNTNGINPELRKQLGNNRGELHRMCAKTRGFIIDEDPGHSRLTDAFGQRDQYLYWCGKCFTGPRGAIYDKAFVKKSAMEKAKADGVKLNNGDAQIKNGKKGKKTEWKKKWKR
ncbi:hypothetical protein GF371_04750 [Candidatus Woesearchaeota archaeon]|nr:hypothetical protein [Candidatus Woesearchaeota archaeon]